MKHSYSRGNEPDRHGGPFTTHIQAKANNEPDPPEVDRGGLTPSPRTLPTS